MYCVLERYYSRPKLPKDPFILAALLVVVALHTLAATAHTHVNLILSILRVVLVGVFLSDKAGAARHLNQSQKTMLDGIPQDIRAVLSMFDLEPDFVPYICCKKCFATYAPEPRPPEACTFRPFPDDPPCNTPLFHPHVQHGDGKPGLATTGEGASGGGASSTNTLKPIKVFGYQRLESWIGRLFSRPGIEAHLDAAWDNVTPGADIWGSQFIQEFAGPDGKSFSFRPNDAAHLVFSLFVDWFNPYGNKQAGKSHSTGAIYMICLNLPMHLRYRLENVYLVGIIPGPREPSLSEINNLLRPVVDALLRLWSTGLFLERTHTRRFGRLVRGALIPVVCDLPALRKVAGFVGHSAKLFCSFCRLSKNDIADLDQSKWPPPYTRAEHMVYAERWRDASDKPMQDKVAERHGIRWSELLRLPYWDPTRFAVVDVMHNLFLGELQHHCRVIWDMNIKDGKSPQLVPHDIETQMLQYQKAIVALRKGSRTALAKLRKIYIVTLVRLNGVVVEGTSRNKADYISALLTWVSDLMHCVST